ncbi:hypothetical protein RQP46_002393 [Phenoliferia psychrophenolica]
MFKRPFTSKTSAPVRSSDLRKLRDELARDFTVPASVAKELLSDGVTTYRGTTHLDEYCTIFSSAAGDPLLFRPGKGTDGALIPTIYALDILGPDFLPQLVTAPEVVEHLVSGSALFSAGVSDKSLRGLPDSMLEGNLVTIVAQGSPHIVAIGQLAASKRDLIASDRKGKAVITLHARGDFLWKSGTGAGGVDATTSALEAVSLDAPPPEATATTSTKPSEEAPSEALTPADVDLILRGALLLAIKTTLSKSTASFPMPASSLYSTYILPFRPAHAASADIKGSSFKKLAQFVKALAKAGYLTAKEVKGDLVVMNVNATHADVVAARSYKTIAQAGASADKATAGASTSSSSASPSVSVRELFKPPSPFLALLPASASRPENDLFLPSELKKLLTDYIASASLTHPRDAKFIQPDASLSSLLLKKGEVLDVLTKDDALKRLKDVSTRFFEVTKGGEEPVVKKGAPPAVKVAIKTVGKRMVTLISGFEPWGLFTADDLAEDLRHRAASSTAVQQIQGSSPKAPKYEVMVQGSHESLVTQALVARGLPKLYIEVDTSKVKR